MRASISKSATAVRNSSGASTFRPPAQRPALAVRPAETSFGHDFSQTPVHAARQPNMLPDFPHAQKLESAFHRNIPGRAVIDEKGCEQRAVPAFTDRTTAHFASPNPPLRVAAHEAVHVLQHSGLSRDAHLGPERHADSVSRLIVRGASVSHLLSSEGAAVEPAIRLYTEIDFDEQGPDNWNANGNLRVSDDGLMAVRQDASRHTFWADRRLISDSNLILASKKSVIRLKTDASSQGRMQDAPRQLTGTVPDGSKRITLELAVPEHQLTKHQRTKTSGDDMEMYADCGRCGGDVMGAGKGYGWGKMTAGYQGDIRPWFSKTPITRPRTTAEKLHPAAMTQEVLNENLGGTEDEGLQKYQGMSEAGQENFDRQTRINRFAAPGTGEGFVISRDLRTPQGENDWPFHWAGVVTASGHDQVTLENLGVPDVNARNTSWKFQMYGPAHKPGQTFYEENKETGAFGGAPIALAVRKHKLW